MTERNTFNDPIYEQDGLQIYFGPTFGKFYIKDKSTGEYLFREEHIKTLDSAKRKLQDALKNKFKSLRVIVKGYRGASYTRKETNAVFYIKDYDSTKVHTVDDKPEGSIFRPASWHYDIRNVYPATEENREKLKTIEAYEKQIKQLRDMIGDLDKSMKAYTLEKLKREAGLEIKEDDNS